jgi:hypothetical protein
LRQLAKDQNGHHGDHDPGQQANVKVSGYGHDSGGQPDAEVALVHSPHAGRVADLKTPATTLPTTNNITHHQQQQYYPPPATTTLPTTPATYHRNCPDKPSMFLLLPYRDMSVIQATRTIL